MLIPTIRHWIIASGYILASLCCAASASADEIKLPFITFEVPGSTYTDPVSINNELSVAGVYADAANVYHGFIRNVLGKITSFDPSGSVQTSVTSINDRSVITGYYRDTAGTHGFIRSAEGHFTSFDAPDTTVTLPVSINIVGTIAGYYVDSRNALVTHGFVRSSSGTITSFDAGMPGASTIPASINVFGAITGRVQTITMFGLETGGFLRSPQGVISGVGIMQPTGINAAGAITGIDENGQMISGALRSPQGALTSFQVMGGPTIASCINAAETIAGQYFVSFGSNVSHGFVRSREGTITSFDPPGSTGTVVNSVNDLGVLTGEFLQANGTYSGFLRLPK